MTDVRLDPVAISAWASGTDARRALERLGEAVAEDARQAAPRDTGAMADSIDYEVGTDSDGAYVRVSWDADHWYGLFSEIGTSARAPRPFLRPAMTQRRAL